MAFNRGFLSQCPKKGVRGFSRCFCVFYCVLLNEYLLILLIYIYIYILLYIIAPYTIKKAVLGLVVVYCRSVSEPLAVYVKPLFQMS